MIINTIASKTINRNSRSALRNIQRQLAKKVSTTRHYSTSLPRSYHSTLPRALASAAGTGTTTTDRSSIRGNRGHYQKEYDLSITNPEQFWSNAATDLHWFKPPEKILESSHHVHSGGANNDDGAPHLFHRWFPGGEINISYNALDVHVRDGRGDQIAIAYDSPVIPSQRTVTYRELLTQVSTFASALKNELGVRKGDRVVIYMPMIPEAIVAMLACNRIGAVHSVVFGG
eukprot:CAMPEP_0172513238 /NCGR_PEP_ID=MMETSP1066-20121228/250863_1 /TAXON_ID=671091 /ORGANISM="Coscinodiscus wailesii, Strain CCMP2513" /LENGTH=229 /DNA_ID=CAMNT_0013293417 /DNA_START=125 /DNA_END=810 /DNA_ORIENTATION=-